MNDTRPRTTPMGTFIGSLTLLLLWQLASMAPGPAYPAAPHGGGSPFL